MGGLIRQLRQWGEFVKFSHTVFAMPFALASMAVAARQNRGWPGWRLFGLIVLAMVCARTCAMSFNRIADRQFDRLNPRTADRHLPAGTISLTSAWVLCILSGGGFLFSKPWEELKEIFAGRRVEAGAGLVENQKLRFRHQRATDQNALTFSL